ncbi:MAG: transposase [Phycisphaerales bacterium]
MTFRTSRSSTRETYQDRHRFEHWYRDNQVYFITARCRDRFRAFAPEQAKQVFWAQFEKYTQQFGFTPWVTSLIDNHYHTLGYLRIGEKLPTMMQRIHGSVAKLVNDLLPVRRVPFWIDTGKHNYFDGCIRDESQCRRAFRYTFTQCKRHGICDHPDDYPHTHVNVELDRGLKRALQLHAFMEDVPYPRYRKHR